MVVDASAPESPGWWLKTLGRQLVDRRIGREAGRKWSSTSSRPNVSRPGLELLDQYRRGEPPLNTVAVEWQPYVREFMRMGRLNISELVVSSTTNRMQVRDFRTAAADDEAGDKVARTIMRANRGKLLTREVHDEMCGFGDGYTITTPGSTPEEIPTITSESPLEVITTHNPATGKPLAGLKLFRDEFDTQDIAYVYIAKTGTIHRYVKTKSTTITAGGFVFSNRWVEDEQYGTNGVVNVPGGRFPIVRFQNKYGVGEFERHLGTLDRINEKIANEWWLGKVQAHRQGAVKGLPDNDPETDEPIDYDDVFVRDPASLWQVPDGVEFWESAPADMTPLILSIEKDLSRLAAGTQTPLTSITPDAANGSAEGASLMREEHIFKVEDRRDRADVGWAETMSLAFAFMDDTKRADVTQIEALWAPLERFSLDQRASAAAQLWGKLPSEAIFTDVLQYAPADIENLRAMAGHDLMYGHGVGPAAG